MKYILKTSLLAILIIGASACKKEEENKDINSPTTATKIEGEWQMTYFVDTVGSVDSQGADPAYIVLRGQAFDGTFLFASNNQITSSTIIDYRVARDVRGAQPDTNYAQHTDYMNGRSWSVAHEDTLYLEMPNGSEFPFYISRLDEQHLELEMKKYWSSGGFDITEGLILKFER